MLAMGWTHLHGRLTQAQRARATVGDAQTAGDAQVGRYERRLLTKLSAIELPSPPSSGIRIQAHR
jgi:hypothetical protein